MTRNLTKERRGVKPPIPAELDGTLTRHQLMTLKQLENFGWQMAFVRRPLFQSTVVVISNAEGDKIGILEEDGELNMQPAIKLRG